MHDSMTKTEGLRERKRRQTLQRIVEVALELFFAKGYEATTLDEIAAAAGIARRTFFHYFKSKDDILLAHQRGYAGWIKESVLKNASAGAPIDVARAGLLEFSSRFQRPEMKKMARLMRESETLRARRQAASYAQFEQAVHEALCELWPGEERSDGLRLVAMASIGAVRVAADAWLQQHGERPLTSYVEDAFRKLKEEI